MTQKEGSLLIYYSTATLLNAFFSFCVRKYEIHPLLKNSHNDKM